MKELSNPDSHLIKNLINYGLKDLTSTKRENIFKIMRKLYHFDKDVVGPQISSNKDFPKIIMVHINSEDKSNISENCFYLLAKLFNYQTFKSQIDEAFILALFESLSFIPEEDILNEIVFILTEINYEYKKPEENLFIKVHKENENSRVINEIILRVLNNEEEDERKIKILKCLDDLMSNYDKCIFYESDLESLIDILLPKLQMTDNNQLKLKLLECLDKVTKYKEYYGEKYKVDEIS